MGSRANVVTMEKGETKIYFFRWLAQEMDAFVILGEENFRRFMDDSCNSEEGCELMDNAWAEGGLLLDFDNKVLIWFGGEDIEGDRPYLDAYMLLLRQAWPEWNVRWANAGNYDIGLYLGLSDGELREIVGTHKKGNRPLEEAVRMFPNERKGLITISGNRGCFTMPTSCYFISELLDFGEELTSLYPSMTYCGTALIDMRPNEYLRHDVEYTADLERKERTWRSAEDKPWANSARGYAEPGNAFPEYGIYIDADAKYLEYWNTCGYYSEPVADGTFPDDWTVVDKGIDYTSHFALAGPSISVELCDPSAYFPVVEGWTLRLCSKSSINALELNRAQIHSYFNGLVDGYAASTPKVNSQR